MPFHFQKEVDDWPRAVINLPPKSSLKVVDRGDIARDALSIKPGVFNVFRHWNDGMQHYTETRTSGWFDWDLARGAARNWFDTHIDETFINNYARVIHAVSWHNEVWAQSQNEVAVAERIAASRAAMWVWNNEYRPMLQSESGNDIKLIIGEAAVGNDMPRDIAKLSISEDGLLGYHPYTWWGNDRAGTFFRAANDWVDLSGRWAVMEERWGLKPTWVFTECGPFEAAETGWRSSQCLAGSIDRYVQAIREWLWDVQETPAYREGRIKGFHLFTSGGEGAWASFDTRQPEMDRIVEMVNQEWHPGTQTPPVEPPVEPPTSGVNYVVVVNLVPQDTTKDEYNLALHKAMFLQPNGTNKSPFDLKQSFLFSADDAARIVAPGKPGSKVIVWNSERWTSGSITEWLLERGVQNIEHARF